MSPQKPSGGDCGMAIVVVYLSIFALAIGIGLSLDKIETRLSAVESQLQSED